MEPVYFKVPRQDEETVRVEYWNLPRFYEPFHYHEECQLTLVLSSSGSVFMGNSLVEYAAGDLFFIGENLPHVLRDDNIHIPRNKNAVSAISVFFSLPSIMRMLEDIPEAFPLQKLLQDSAFGFKIKDAAQKKIGEHMKTIRDSFGFVRIMELLQILILFASSPHTEKLTLIKSAPLDRFQRNNLNKVFDYVMAHYHEKITLEEISSLVYMTPNAFCRFFKKHTQKSFSSFLIEVRVNKACKMLQDSASSVSDSCYSSGYNNISNFHRHFRRVVGMTPNEYKKQLVHSTL